MDANRARDPSKLVQRSGTIATETVATNAAASSVLSGRNADEVKGYSILDHLLLYKVNSWGMKIFQCMTLDSQRHSTPRHSTFRWITYIISGANDVVSFA